jgi:hypothetical protein
LLGVLAATKVNTAIATKPTMIGQKGCTQRKAALVSPTTPAPPSYYAGGPEGLAYRDHTVSVYHDCLLGWYNRVVVVLLSPPV